MEKSTRVVKVGMKTVIIQNVPRHISDEELKKYTLQKLLEIYGSKGEVIAS